MAAETSINWSELSWGIFEGCSECAPECAGCYARILVGTRLRHLEKFRPLTVIKNGKPCWTGLIHFSEELLTWAIRREVGKLVFTNSKSDPFHPNATQEMRDKFFAAMLLGNQHVYQVLTKRPAEMAAYINDPDTLRRVSIWAGRIWADHFTKVTRKKPKGNPFPADRIVWPLPHVWLGCSAGSQTTADIYLPQLLRIPAGWLLWVSAEPLIASLNFRPEWLNGSAPSKNRVQWIVTGGESGARKTTRPMLGAWQEQIRRDCIENGVAYWDKQPGAWHELKGEEREALANDTAALHARMEAGTVCTLNVKGKTVRGAKVVSELLRGPEAPLFIYGDKEGESQYRAFPQFPDTFARGPELAAAHPIIS